MRVARILVVAAVALATVAAWVVGARRPAEAPAPYTPADPRAVLARVAPRGPDAARLAVAVGARDDVVLAAAEADVERGTAQDDPRALRRAASALARWGDAPPPEVRWLRAEIAHADGDLAAARAEIDALVAARPDDLRAHLLRATIAADAGDLAGARTSCAAVARAGAGAIAAVCAAPLDGLSAPAAAAAAVDAVVTPELDAGVRAWALAVRGELARQTGDAAGAVTALSAALALDPEAIAPRAALAEALVLAGRPGEAVALLAGREGSDRLLVRRAIAARAAGHPEAAALADRARAQLARPRLDQLHDRAWFALSVEGDAADALATARRAWAAAPRLANARLLAAAAAAAHDADALATVRAWAATTHVSDAELARVLAGAP